MNIAMWSGPRNLSTAMMYSFASRNDCSVVDEPFYAAYLDKTGLDHPMRHEILAGQSVNAEQIIAEMKAPKPAPVFYQKHMTQHMIPAIPQQWILDVTNVFLIRHPARVMASFAAKYEAPTLSDIGSVQQAGIFDFVVASGAKPVVIDSSTILANPKGALQALCCAIGIEWQQQMLSWPTGGNSADGIWAKHWYGSVHASTGFAQQKVTELPKLSCEYKKLADEALPYYQRLQAYELGHDV